MKSKVAIGITTYKDISAPSVATAVYGAYGATSLNLVPDRIDVDSSRYDVHCEADFASKWYSEVPFKVQERKNGPIVKSGIFRVGAEWRRRTSLRGMGRVHFRPETDWAGADSIAITHDYSAKINWPLFFQRLIDITEPAFAMLHLFNGSEGRESGGEFGLADFNEPVIGEGPFTQWVSSAGTLRGPDRFRVEERRIYRFLPDLPWAMFLGPQFNGQYDATLVPNAAFKTSRLLDGLLVQATPQFSDLTIAGGAFEVRKSAIKQTFPDGFFRR